MAAKKTDALVATDEKKILAALNNTDQITVLAEEVKAIVKAFTSEKEYDVEKAADRTAIKSMAAKVSKTKTTVDDLGKNYLAETKKKLKEIDDRRKWFREEMDIVKESVRRPVTEWEQIRKDIDAILANWQNILNGLSELCTVKEVRDVIAMVEISDPETIVQDKRVEFETTRTEILGTLQAKLDAAIAREEQAAELERLRFEKAEAEKEAEIQRRLAEEAQKRANAPAERPQAAPETPQAPPPAPIAPAPAEAVCGKCGALKALIRDMYEVVTVADHSKWAENWTLLRERMTELGVY